MTRHLPTDWTQKKLRSHHLKPSWRAAALLAAAMASPAVAQTSLTGSSMVLRTDNSSTLSSTGYLGTYLTVPAGGSTLHFTVRATRGNSGSGTPHAAVAIADSNFGFNVTSTSSTNYNTPSVTLPEGTYFLRTERDYPGNVGVTRSLTVNSVALVTDSGAAATFSNTSSDTNARNAADTYINNFRKGDATIAMTGAANLPLLPGTPVHVKLARHAFNWGTEVPGNNADDVNSLLGTPTTEFQQVYQHALAQNFNSIVPSNAGKWQNNEATRNAVTMGGVDAVLDYAQSHHMRARMHNLIWADTTNYGQQPDWVMNSAGNGLLNKAAGGDSVAAADLRNAISSRIGYYVSGANSVTAGNPARSTQYSELDVYNESFHAPAYTTAYGYGGVAGIYNEAAAAAGPNVKMFTNDFSVFQDGGNAFANWYVGEVEAIRKAGGNVGGIGIQYYANPTIGTADNQHSAARIYGAYQSLAVEHLPMALNEFAVDAGGEANAPQILDDSMRLTFGTPGATGFNIWGFYAGEGLTDSPAAALYDENFNLTASGTKYQELLGITNPGTHWNTDLTTYADANGAIHFNGFYGDYYLRDQSDGAYDVTLAKGTTRYAQHMEAPPTWSLWNTSTNSGAWSGWENWTTTTGPADAAGQTAYFGPASELQFVSLEADCTVGMVVLNSSSPYYISGYGTMKLQGFDNPAGHVAVINVLNGSHSISAPLLLLDNTTVNIANSADMLFAWQLQPTTATLTKTGPGTLVVNQLRTGDVAINAGHIKLLPTAAGGATSKVPHLAIATGASLDLADNSLVVGDPLGEWNGTAYTGVLGLVARGCNGGSWDGDGIATSLTVIGERQAFATLAVATAYVDGSFGGVPISASDTIVMYTYAGDATLDGKVDSDDYFQIDSAYAGGSTPSYTNGDFNYDGKINADDYFIIDRSFARQGPPLIFGQQFLAAAVPEPTSTLPLLAFSLLARRKPRRAFTNHK